MEHLRRKHNYRPSLEEERSARETMEKAKIEHESNKTEEPLPSFRGKRKTPMTRMKVAFHRSGGNRFIRIKNLR